MLGGTSARRYLILSRVESRPNNVTVFPQLLLKIILQEARLVSKTPKAVKGIREENLEK